MIDLLKLGLIPCYLMIICYLLGILFLNSAKKSTAQVIIAGFGLLIGTFQVLAIPFMYYEATFDYLYYVYIVVVLILCLIGAGKIFIHTKKHSKYSLQIEMKFIDNKILLGIFVAIIALQILWVVYYQHIDIDDSFYLAQTNTILHTNRILNVEPASGIVAGGMPVQYKLVGYEVFIAVIAKLFTVNTAFLTHTILPVFFIPLHYLIMYLIGKKLYYEKGVYFALLYALVNMCSGYSVYSQGSFLLYRIWQGKAVLIYCIIPLLILKLLIVFEKSIVTRKDIAFLTLILYSGFRSTTVGLYLVPIAYFSIVLSYTIYVRKWKNVMKLCIPVVFSMPYVFLKFILLYGSADGKALDAVTHDAESISWITEFFERFMNTNTLLVLVFALALCALFISNNKKILISVALPSVVIILTFANPICSTFAAKYITGSEVYWRLFWLLEIPLVIVCAMMLLIQQASKKNTVLALIVCVLIINSIGNFILDFEGFEKRANKYKIPKDTLEIVEAVRADMVDESTLLMPVELSYGVREYCGDVKLLINRYNIYDENIKERLTQQVENKLYTEKDWEIENLLSELEYFDVDYLVLYKESINDNSVVGLKLIYETDNHCVFTRE